MNISLSRSQSIVLFEFLCRINKVENDDFFEDHSEKRVLWDLESVLESGLTETFKNDYQQILDVARKDVRDNA